MGDRADPALAAPALEEEFALEIMRSERARMAILAGLLGAVAAIFPVFALAERTYYMETFGSPVAGALIVGTCALLAGYELLVRAFVGRRLAQARPLPTRLRYWNAPVETSMPTILIALVSRHVEPVYVLQGPGPTARSSSPRARCCATRESRRPRPPRPGR